MFYVKLAETEHHPSQLFAVESEDVRWSRAYFDLEDGEVPDDLIWRIAKENGASFEIGHVGELEAQHDKGITVNWVHWFTQTHGVMVISSQRIYILGENGKTLDRV